MDTPTYTTLDILKAARATLANPENWTKGCYARDAAGNMCKPYSPNAVKWCAIGTCALVSNHSCLLYTSPSPRDRTRSRMPSSA